MEQRLGLVDADGLLDSARQGGTLRILHRNELEGAALVLRGVPDHLVEIGTGNHAAGREGLTVLQAHRVGGSLTLLALNGGDAHEGRGSRTVCSVEDVGADRLALVIRIGHGYVGLVGGQRRGLVNGDGLLDGAWQGRALGILHRNELERTTLVLRGIPDHLVKIGAGNHAADREGVTILQAHRVGSSLTLLALNGRDAHEGGCGFTVRSVEDVSADRLALVIRIGHGHVGLVGGQRRGLVNGDGLLERARQSRTLRILNRDEAERTTLVLRGVPHHLVKIGAGDDLIGDDGVSAQQAHSAGGSLAILALDGCDAHEGGSRLIVGAAEDSRSQGLVFTVRVGNRCVLAVGGQRLDLRHRVSVTPFRRFRRIRGGGVWRGWCGGFRGGCSCCVGYSGRSGCLSLRAFVRGPGRGCRCGSGCQRGRVHRGGSS